MAARITPEVTQRVRDVIDIVDIASELTRLQRRGRKYVALCPFHKEKTPSFQIDPDLGLYHCFGCGAGGDAIRLHMEHSGDDFKTAIEALARRYNVPLPEGPAGDAMVRRDTTTALEAALGFFRRTLAESDFARRYLDERRIPAELRERFGLGYAPDGWQHLLDALRGRVSPDDLLEAGLVGRSDRTGNLYDRFRHRLMFPIHSAAGRLVGFGGRTLGDDRAKYVNTAETPAFRKGELLYGLHVAKRAIRDHGRAVLVEGYFDVIGAVACGVEGAVAAMGTALTAEQAGLLARFADEVVLAYDGDDAGELAARRSLPILLAAGLGARRAPFPEGHDPDSLRLEAGPEAVVALVDQAHDALEHEIDRLVPPGGQLDPRAQAGVADAMRELLAPLRDPVIQRAYARRAAQRLSIDESLLLHARSARDYGRSFETRKETRSNEDVALRLLLDPDVPTPPVEDLPPSGAFLEPSARSIYEIFHRHYLDHDEPPDAATMLARLDELNADVSREKARLADLLLAEAHEGAEVHQILDSLTRRWVGQRMKQVVAEISRAQQAGDGERLQALLEEKLWLSRQRHPKMTGRVW